MTEGPADQLRRVTSQRRVEEDKATQQRREDSSKERLHRIIQKKLMTAGIGAMSRMEKHIGRQLWGHDTPPYERSPAQEEWNEVWQECRTDILNHINGIMRAVDDEFKQYTMMWNRYQTIIPADGADKN